jgi:hypothetical protein
MRSFSQTDEHALTERRHAVHCASRVEVNPGDQFGSWTVVKEAPMRPGWRRYVLVKCAKCEHEKEVYFDNLRRGLSKGCRECFDAGGNAQPPWLVARFSQAKQRCERSSHPAWNDYGGRGIEFRFESVSAAVAWALANVSPKQELLLDRIDNDGHYEPGNIRFTSIHESQMNRRNTKLPADWVFRPEEWPYSQKHVEKLLRLGWSRQDVIDNAREHLRIKVKTWRKIAAWFASTTS